MKEFCKRLFLPPHCPYCNAVLGFEPECERCRTALPRLVCGPEPIACRKGLFPVSYTHLDVYKRQYAARWVAKNIVAAGFASRCEVQLAYAIGVAEPVSIRVDTFGTGTVDETAIEQAVEKVFDLRPAAIIEQLDLRRPIYRNLAAYGHMGREDLGVKWENTDRVDALKAAVRQ